MAQAQAHKTWWGDANHPGSAAGKYLQWVKDESTAHAHYSRALAAHYHTKLEGDAAQGIVGIHRAQRNYAVQLAAAAHARDTQQAIAREGVVTSLLPPTTSYLATLAQAQRDKAVQLAQAAYDRAVRDASFGGASLGLYEAELAAAENQYASTL